jgi:hypothetical protein
MTLQLLPSAFPIYEKKFLFFSISVVVVKRNLLCAICFERNCKMKSINRPSLLWVMKAHVVSFVRNCLECKERSRTEDGGDFLPRAEDAGGPPSRQPSLSQVIERAEDAGGPPSRQPSLSQVIERAEDAGGPPSRQPSLSQVIERTEAPRLSAF